MARSSAVIRMAHTLLRSSHGKRVGAAALRGAAGVADRATGSRHSASIERARAAAERGLRGL